MKNVSLEVKKFIEENKFKYLEFLSQIEGFPYVCDISSTIMDVYLYKRFGLSLSHIDGDYNDDIHFWLQFNDDTILDFVGFQFNCKLANMNVEELKKNLDSNYPYVMKENTIHSNYFPLTEVFVDYFVEFGAFDNYDFDAYLEQVSDILIDKGFLLDKER